MAQARLRRHVLGVARVCRHVLGMARARRHVLGTAQARRHVVTSTSLRVVGEGEARRGMPERRVLAHTHTHARHVCARVCALALAAHVCDSTALRTTQPTITQHEFTDIRFVHTAVADMSPQCLVLVFPVPLC